MGLAAAVLAAAALAGAQPADPAATRETSALFRNMRALAARGVMFGHQDSLAYGYRWRGERDRSDVKDVTGRFPAVYGFDLGDLFQRGHPDVPDPAGAARLRDYVRQVHARGGIVTFSWHMPNPLNDTDAWNTAAVVPALLPGGALASDYRQKLAVAARFFRSLRDDAGRPIPVWFRPFHEMTGDWFWWGRTHAACPDYIALWRETARGLRHAGVHNILLAYSTDVFDGAADYFACYPGDGYVDLLGFDDYHSIEDASGRDVFVRRLRDVARWAATRGKVAALTETGREAVPDATWWTGVLLPGLRAAPGISYALVWRNANPATDRKEHYFAPYTGQRSAADFVAFERDPWTLFEPDLPPLYRSR